MKKKSIWGEIKDTIQETVPNIELIGLLISIVLGGAGAILFFLNSLNKLDLLSISRTELIGATIFLWAILAFYIYPIILTRSKIIEFLHLKYVWQFVGWLILIFTPYLIVWVLTTNQNYIELLIFLGISILFLGLIGIILAAEINLTIPLHMVIKRLKLIMAISFIIYVIFYLALLSVISTENKVSFLKVFFNSTWKDFLISFSQSYGFICLLIMIFLILLYKFQQIYTIFGAMINFLRHTLNTIKRHLIGTIRIIPFFVNTLEILILYFLLTFLVGIIFDLYKFGTQRPFFSPFSIQEIVAMGLYYGAILPMKGLFFSTAHYLLPYKLEQIHLPRIERLIFMLFILFSSWWIFFAAFAQNMSLFNQHTFVYADGRTGKPNIFDFLFYIFALMTSAGYGELKPLSLGAHILVMLVTATGLALLIIFVGAALSIESKSSRVRGRRKM